MCKKDELKTCPFCGSSAHPFHNGLDLWSIDCDNCSVRISQSGGGFLTEEEAAKSWNQRAVTKHTSP